MKTNVANNLGRKKLRAQRTKRQPPTGQPLTLPISSLQIIVAVKKMKKSDRYAFLEDLLAATSPEYLASIRAARDDYRHGRVLSHEEVFGKIR